MTSWDSSAARALRAQVKPPPCGLPSAARGAGWALLTVIALGAVGLAVLALASCAPAPRFSDHPVALGWLLLVCGLWVAVVLGWVAILAILEARRGGSR